MAFEADGLFTQDLQNSSTSWAPATAPDGQQLLGLVDVNQDSEIGTGQAQDVEVLDLATDLSLLQRSQLGQCAHEG